MRMRSSLFIGLCLSLAACTVSTASEPSGAGPEDPAAEGSAAKGANEANAAGESNAAEPGDDEGANALPSESAETDGGVDSGSSAKPEVDAGADAAPPKQTIPAPTKGFLHAYPTNGTCDFSIEGVYKSSGSALDVSLYADAYVIGCKHSSGKYVEDFAIILELAAIAPAEPLRRELNGCQRILDLMRDASGHVRPGARALRRFEIGDVVEGQHIALGLSDRAFAGQLYLIDAPIGFVAELDLVAHLPPSR